jgi:hypothetical protein
MGVENQSVKLSRVLENSPVPNFSKTFESSKEFLG